MKKSQWQKDFEAFYEKYPDCPLSEDIESLSLVMKREYAEQIKNGTKVIEFRDFSDFYCKRLFDKEVDAYVNAHKDNQEVMDALHRQIVTPLRIVNNLHFHNYNNSWFLDVECTFNDTFSVTKNDIEFLQEEYDCHEFDEDLESLEAANVPEKERPYIFYFVIGKVLDTNLETKSEK
jgi:hypothetical protein